MRGHVIGVRHGSGRPGVRRAQPPSRFGMNGIIVGVNEIVQHSRMLLVVRVDRFEEGDRTALHLESLCPFSDGAENRQTIKQRRLIVGILRVRGGHLLAVGLVARLLGPRAGILVKRGCSQEIHVLAIVLRPSFEALLHVRPCRRFVLARRRIPERVVVGHGRAPVGHGAVGIRFLDLLKLREGPRVPEVMEKGQRAIESGLHSRSARRLHVCCSNTFGAVAVLSEQTRGAEATRPAPRTGIDRCGDQRTQGMSIDELS